MIIVAGHLIVDPAKRDAYLSTCTEAVRAARSAPGCLDFSLTPDLLDDSRVNVFERWESPQHVAAFRGEGPGEDQQAALRGGSVAEYDVGGTRPLLGG
ncbi:antibiotic biosynthesis monooxygenase family protein [Pseudonocardia nematodicida]|uniref:Antibiotic biosynthesis monooxygenase family protein n=1 Tax=Pseudonocardia nematodicida TaxID=1206997 RepID=A0ABV1K9K1_9PSEU